MKNRIVALALTLVMVLSVAIASAATIPGNVADIADLPGVPAVPTLKVKANDHTATITLSQEVDFVNAWWNWAPTAIEMNGTTGTYRVDSHKFQVGMGTWGQLNKPVEVKNWVKNYRPVAKDGEWDYTWAGNAKTVDTPWGDLYGNLDPDPATLLGDKYDASKANYYYPTFKFAAPEDATKEEYEAFLKGDAEYKSKFVDGIKQWTHVWKAGKDAQGNDVYKKYTYFGGFGTYELGFAYDLAYTDEEGNQIYVRYDRFGNPVQIEKTIFGGYDPFMSEVPASSAKITWVVVIRSSLRKRVWLVDNIKVSYDEGDIASITGVYFSAKKQNKGALVDHEVVGR